MKLLNARSVLSFSALTVYPVLKMRGSYNRGGITRWLMALGFVSLGFSLGVVPVKPAQANDFTQRGYVGIGVGITRLEPEGSSDALTISDNSDTGAHLAAGYDFNRFLTVEGYVATLGEAQAEFLGVDAGSVDYTVFGISALGYLINSRSGLVFGDDDLDGLYRREGASLYGRVGLGHMTNDSERVQFRRDHPNHAVFGLGVEYGFSNGIALRTEIMAMDTDARYLNIGVLKRFGDVAGANAPLAAAALPVVAAQAATKPETQDELAASAQTQEPKLFRPVQTPFIYFAFDESELVAESKQKLDEFATKMLDNNLQMLVEGHTDWIAAEAYNLSLSVRRAEAVANYIESKGIDRERIKTVGYGETRPISTNDTVEGRTLNRRSEIVLQSPLQPQASL